MRWLVLPLLAGILLTGCAGPNGATSGQPQPGSPSTAVTVPGAGQALLWGDGPYGLVLLHASGEPSSTWEGQAVTFAADRMTVLAPEVTGTEALRAAITWLEGRGVARVAVLAVGDAGRSVAQLGATDPALVDQAILVSPPAGLDWTAQFPKLFAASEGESAAGAAREAAAQAGGAWNVLDLVSGSASGSAIFASPVASDLMSAILRRLDERR
jgi:hypothetical protein